MLNVNIDRRLPTESCVQQVILRRRGKILVSSYDVGYAHCVVVNDIGEVVGRHSIRLQKHLVVQVNVLNGDVAVDLVMERGSPVVRDLLADNAGFAGVVALLRLGSVHVAAGAAVRGSKSVCGVLAAVLVLATEAVVCVSGFHQLLCILLEHTHSLALYIRTAGTADVRTLVPVQSAGPERSVDNIGSALNVASLVGILNTQNKLALVLSRDKIGVQRSAQVAYVHVPSGAGCKSCPDFHLSLSFRILRLTAVVAFQCSAFSLSRAICCFSSSSPENFTSGRMKRTSATAIFLP